MYFIQIIVVFQYNYGSYFIVSYVFLHADNEASAQFFEACCLGPVKLSCCPFKQSSNEVAIQQGINTCNAYK